MSYYAQEDLYTDEDAYPPPTAAQTSVAIEPSVSLKYEEPAYSTQYALDPALFGQPNSNVPQLEADHHLAETTYQAPSTMEQDLTLQWYAESSKGADELEAIFDARFVLVDPAGFLSQYTAQLYPRLKKHIEGIARSTRNLGSAQEGTPRLRLSRSVHQRQTLWSVSMEKAAKVLTAAMGMWTRELGLPDLSIKTQQTEDNADGTSLQTSGLSVNLSITNRFWRGERDLNARSQIQKRPVNTSVTASGEVSISQRMKSRRKLAIQSLLEHALADYEYAEQDGPPTYVVSFLPDGRHDKLRVQRINAAIINTLGSLGSWRGDLDSWPGATSADQARAAAQLNDYVLSKLGEAQSNVARVHHPV